MKFFLFIKNRTTKLKIDDRIGWRSIKGILADLSALKFKGVYLCFWRKKSLQTRFLKM